MLVTSLLAAVAPASRAEALDSSPVALLLVHGFDDSCYGAFESVDNKNKGPYDAAAQTYFQSHGWHNDIDAVGYYAGHEAGCTGDPSADTTIMGTCGALNSKNLTFTNTPIEYLGCLLAWYIYNNYTSKGWSVDILAHSMGGLVTRAALGFSGPGTPYSAEYPPQALGVTRVVTVATPHGGLYGEYLSGAQSQFPNQYEVAEMTMGSTFLNQLPQRPQGAAGTWWGLMGASVGGACVSTGAGLISCLAQSDNIADPEYQISYHDGDGVVQSSSMMAMNADMKVLYGHVEGVVRAAAGDGSLTTVRTEDDVAGIGLAGEYNHEANSCATYVGHSFCTGPPFYLNDATPATTQTKAWICSSNCTSEDVNGPGAFADLNVSGSPVTAPYSLAAIGSMLPAPQSPPVYDVPGFAGFFTKETDGSSASAQLGAATGWWQPVKDSTGYAIGAEQSFVGGTIYDDRIQATVLYGSAVTAYEDFGGPTSVLGFPSGDEAPDNSGGQQVLFYATSCQNVSGINDQYGSAILVGHSTPAAEIQGCIYQAYMQKYGGPSGSLGYPISNELGIAGGKVNYFAGSPEAGCGNAYPKIDGATATAGIYWDTTSTPATVYAVTGCDFASFYAHGELTGLGYPLSDPVSTGGGLLQSFQTGELFDRNGTVTFGNWIVGHAAHAGNDYPYETIGQFGHQNEGTDAWNEYYGQCDSFAAWKVYENLAGSAAQHPSIVPAPGWTPSNASTSPVNQFTFGPNGGLGNADAWAAKFASLGYTVDAVPAPGAVAYWANGAADAQDGLAANPAGLPGSTTGHVGYVSDVYPDGSIDVESYNMRANGQYSRIHMAYGQGYTDSSFGLGGFNVTWPTSFIHIADGPSGESSPSEPASGVAAAGYPAQVKVIGPTSSAGEFSTGDVWYTRAGHGEVGAEIYTHSNGPTAVSTATWTPAGLAANTCYRVDAFVPDNYSDNPISIYTIESVSGTSIDAVNENDVTNDWAQLGVFKTSGSGALSVRLDDRGNAGLYVAADAMRFWQQADCAGQGDASPIIAPTSTYSPSGTSWSTRSGHGFFGSMQYTTTTGTDYPIQTATWTPGHLLPNRCYDVALYVPDDYSDTPAAAYNSTDAFYGGNFWEQVDENSYTNQFAAIGTLQSDSNGYLTVSLQNSGPAGDYVAADAAAFVLNPTCAPLNSGTSTFGGALRSGILGPGSPPSSFTTTGNWAYYLGFGYAAHQLYAPDNSGATATWTYTGNANTCYTIDVYVPIMGYADNSNATYTFTSSLGGASNTIDQNTAGGWTRLAGLTTGGDGVITVKLTDAGTSGGYTAADEIRFTPTC